MEQTSMLLGCAIALVPLGLVVLCLVVLGIIGAMRCTSDGCLQIRLTLPPDHSAPLWQAVRLETHDSPHFA
jgi:hypothetical protein